MMDKKEDGELKTLREIEIKIIENTKLWKQNWLQQTSTVIAELRLEAIKWIKEDIDKDNSGLNKFELIAIRSWIKHFFNISEEDLKEVDGK